MGLLNELKKFVRPDDDDPEFEAYLPRVEQVPIEPRASRSKEQNREADKVVNIRATTQLQVVLVKPDRFENAVEIADHLREKRTVMLNLEQADKEIARRLVDFLSGVSYMQDGKIKKVAVSTYIITPYHVDIVGDLLDERSRNGEG